MSLVEFFFNGDYRESLSDGNQVKSKKTSEPTEEERKKSREEFGKHMTLQYAREYLDRLIDNIRYDFIDYTEITEDKFRNYFKYLKHKDWVIDVMWEEYSDYITKYKKK